MEMWPSGVVLAHQVQGLGFNLQHRERERERERVGVGVGKGEGREREERERRRERGEREEGGGGGRRGAGREEGNEHYTVRVDAFNNPPCRITGEKIRKNIKDNME
jgi:hypothetical protein